jgi:hypothetical protein
MEHEVKGCNDCPLYYYEAEWETSTCQHPLVPVKIGKKLSGTSTVSLEIELNKKYGSPNYYQPITPDWCPLKHGPLVLTIEGGFDEDEILAMCDGGIKKV